MKTENEIQTKTTVKVPASVFKVCPQCRSPNLIQFDGEVFCGFCSWDSVLLHEECRQTAFFYQRQHTRPS